MAALDRRELTSRRYRHLRDAAAAGDCLVETRHLLRVRGSVGCCGYCGWRRNLDDGAGKNADGVHGLLYYFSGMWVSVKTLHGVSIESGGPS